MKYPSLLSILATAAFLLGCSKAEPVITDPAIISFGITDLENRTHVAKIDDKFKTVKINTITDPGQVAGAKFRLTPNTTISPDPSTLATDCIKNNKFTLTCGERTAVWHVIFPKFKNEDEEKEWMLEWEDNFDGNWFDTKVWGMTPKGNPDWCKMMAPFKELYEVKDGILTLWAQENTTHPEDPRKALTGGLWTRNLKSFKDGKLVIRARHDKAGGFWPAIWLRPQDGPAEEYSEVDIVELVKGKAHQTVHTDYTLANKNKPGLGNTVSVTLENFEGWHEYSVEFQQDCLILGIDGNKTLTYRKRDIPGNELQQFPFGDRSFYLILSAQLGGQWAGNPVMADLPCALQIDYVKYYRLK